jgi:flagellar assembly protein FliH
MAPADLVRELELPDLEVRGTDVALRTTSGESFAAGFAAGYADGLRRASLHAAREAAAHREEQGRAEVQRDAAVARALQAVAAAGDRLAMDVDSVVAALTDRLSGGAVDLAEAVLGAELGDPGRRAAAAVRRVVGAAGSTGATITLRMNPADVAALAGAAEPDGVRLVPDPGVLPGDATGETPEQWIDARVGAALARAAAAAREARPDELGTSR